MANPDSMLVPGDFDVQSAAIQRKRDLIEAMVKRNKYGEGKMVGNAYIAPHWTEAVAELGSAYLARKRNKDLDKEMAELNANEREGLAGAIDSYLTKKQGIPDQEVEGVGPMPDGSALPNFTQEGVKADPRAAMMEALASRHKPMQEVGRADLANIGRSEKGMTAKDIMGLTGYTGKSKQAAAASGDIGLLVPEGKSHVINNRLVKEGEGQGTVIGEFGDKYGAPSQIGVDAKGNPLIGQIEKGTGKAAYAPGGGTVVNVDTDKKTANAFGVAGAEAAVKNLTESATAAKKAQQSYETFMNARTLMNDVKGGTGADLILGAKKIAQQLGMPIDDSITSTEQVTAALGQAVLDNAKQLGTGSGFSNTDREFLEKIVSSKGTLDAQTLRRAVNIGLSNNLNTMRHHAKKLKEAEGIPGANEAILNQFAVEVPSIELDANEFSYDPKTQRFGVKSTKPVNQQMTAPVAAQKPLPPAEQSELERLRAKYGRTQ